MSRNESENFVPASSHTIPQGKDAEKTPQAGGLQGPTGMDTLWIKLQQNVIEAVSSKEGGRKDAKGGSGKKDAGNSKFAPNAQGSQTIELEGANNSMKFRRNSSKTSLGPEKNGKYLPSLEEIKRHGSYLIGSNTARGVKAFDFTGYARRKEIFDGFPKPVESRFEHPSKLCPLVSTKHKR